MSPPALGVCLALATVALAVAAGHVCVALASHLASRTAWGRLGARTRASLLAQARLAPLTLAVVGVPLVQTAFWRFEPVHQSEPVGVLLPLLAAIGAGLVITVARRAWLSLWTTQRIARTWRRAGARAHIAGWQGPAWVVCTPFPVVAVVGVGRAELYVSHTVLGACDAAEMAAIAAHERAHVAGHDNLTRLLFALAPGPGRAAARLERAWTSTAEEIADVHARATGDGVTLALALIKVARLAVGAPPAPALAISALIGDDTLERRVRRLLEPAQPPGAVLRGWPTAAVAPVALAALAWGLPAIYGAAEFLVTFGR